MPLRCCGGDVIGRGSDAVERVRLRPGLDRGGRFSKRALHPGATSFHPSSSRPGAGTAAVAMPA